MRTAPNAIAARQAARQARAAERDERVRSPLVIRIWQCPRIISGQARVHVPEKSHRVRQPREPQRARSFLESEKIVWQIKRAADLVPALAAAAGFLTRVHGLA